MFHKDTFKISLFNQFIIFYLFRSLISKYRALRKIETHKNVMMHIYRKRPKQPTTL